MASPTPSCSPPGRACSPPGKPSGASSPSEDGNRLRNPGGLGGALGSPRTRERKHGNPLWILKHDDIRKPLLAKCQPTLFKIDKPIKFHAGIEATCRARSPSWKASFR